ncbi:MAG: UbiX family flavin prenyltransferase [Dehalococcoidia bacterium]
MSIYTLAISGSSGVPYTRRVLQQLLISNNDIKLVISEAGKKVIEVEEGIKLDNNLDNVYKSLLNWTEIDKPKGSLEIYHSKDVSAPIASGSFPVTGMAIVPCSGGTIGRVANGISNGLIERAADVCLKERKRLIIVPREMPISLVHLRNMTSITEAGGIILPASPGFYHKPKTISDLVDTVAGRILSLLGLDNNLLKPWLGVDKGE